MKLARHAALAASLALFPQSSLAQDDDGGFLQRLIQDKLSGSGREVSITGFEGLLSGAARLDELTIADDEGVWLTVRNAELDWSRAALLRGNLAVETLKAGELILERLPASAPEDEEAGIAAPKAEASGFALPELPVSIQIGNFAIDRAELGEAIIADGAVLGLEGAVQLANGEGKVDLETRRLDGPDDHLSLHGSFVNESRTLSVDLEFEEAEGGVVSNLMRLPGTPSILLKIEGEGPINDFNAQIAFATEGENRITGEVNLNGDGAGGIGITADLGGNLTPLLPVAYHEFFGDELRLSFTGTRSAEGTLDVPAFALSARSVDLDGTIAIGSDGMPTAFDISGNVGHTEGIPLLLPVSGGASYVDTITLSALFDLSASDRWTLKAAVDGLATEAARLETLELDGVGRIVTTEGAAITADLIFDVTGLEMADMALTEAIGSDLSGGAGLSWQRGGALDVTRLYANGEDYSLTSLGDLRIAERSLKVSGEARLSATDISRFSSLAGRPLTGIVDADISGQGDPLGGLFAGTVEIAGSGLSIGQETADRLLEGTVALSATARRDTQGTVLDVFELRSEAITADAQGRVGSGASDIGFEATLEDVGLVLPGHEGSLTLAGDAREDVPGDWQVGLELNGPYELDGTVSGRVHPGESDLNLDLSLPDIAPLVPDHTGPLQVVGSAEETAQGKWQVDLDVSGPYAATAGVEGLVAPGETEVSLEIALPDVAPLLPGHSGAVALSGEAAQTEAGGWQFTFGGTGPYEATVELDGTMGAGPGQITLSAELPDIAPLAPGFTGPLKAEGTATDAGDGLWQIDFDAGGPYDGKATVDGVVGGGKSKLALDISLPDLSPIVPQVSGPVSARGTAAEAGDGRWNVDFDLNGPQAAKASIAGAVGATGTDVTVGISVPQVAAFVPSISGPLEANAQAAQDESGAWTLALDASGPYSGTVTASGTYGAGQTNLIANAALPDVGALVPSLSGPITLQATANEPSAGTWNVVLDAGLPYNGTANIAGQVSSGATALDLQVNLPSVAPYVPGLTGGFSANGRVTQQPGAYGVSLDTSGPQGVSSTISGTVAEDFSTVALEAIGTAPLALANGALAPRATNGTARFDISVNGAPSLESVSGTVSVNGADLVLPTLRQSLTGINAQVGLSGSTVQIDVTADGPAGGTIGANGSVQISGGMNADLTAKLNQFVLTDPSLFSTTLDGSLSVAGPLTGGAQISGRVKVGRTEIRIPDGGLGFGGTIPTMTHINEPFAVHLTRERAGLIEKEKSSPGGAGGGGPSYGLDIAVAAPEQIFIRGRGLDTELGGGVVVRGTTAYPIAVGEIKVIRGRLDILGQRLEVTEGTISLAGGLIPYLDITATASREEFEFVARITGPVDDPQFKLTSVPDLPQDEVLSHFLFGSSVTDLSALQAVQLASAVATLSGRGGPGLLGGVREGLGLDDLDLATTDDGGTEVRAGKYLTDNIYTEFVAGSDGESELDIKIDVTKNFTIKGTAGSTGESSIGVYFERDY